MADFISIKDYFNKKNQEYRLYIPFKAISDSSDFIDTVVNQYELADKTSVVFGGMTPMLSVGCFGFDSFDKARFAADFCGAKAIITLTIKKKVKGLCTDEVFWTPYVENVDDDLINRAKTNGDDISFYRMKRINWYKSDLEKLGAKFEITLINIDRESVKMGYVNDGNGKVVNLGQYDEKFMSAIQSAYPKKHITQRRLDAKIASKK